jgi:hypothetical protein
VATGEATRVVGVKLVVALFDFIEISVFFSFVATGKGRRVVGGKLVLALFDFTEFGKLVGGGDSLIFGIFIFLLYKDKKYLHRVDFIKTTHLDRSSGTRGTRSKHCLECINELLSI